MRVFITVLVLIFSLQSWTKADDIKDFEIEGMSIGDSLLDYFSEEEINQSKSFYPASERFFYITKKISTMKLYDKAQFHVKNNDTNYTIYSISGLIYFRDKKDNLNECIKIKNEIVKEITNSIIVKKEVTINDEGIVIYKQDKSGKSKHDTVYFDFKSGHYIKVGCMDYSNTFSEEMGWDDHLRISINTKEYLDWLDDEAFD